MFERSELALKIFCGAMVALVLYRLALVIVHFNPLSHVVIPALPSLTATAATGGANKSTNSPGTPAKPGTNGARQLSAFGGTNTAAHTTNFVSTSTNRVDRTTNALVSLTNLVSHGTNLVAKATGAARGATNSLAGATNLFRSQTNGAPGRGALPPPEFAQMRMPFGGGMPGMPTPGPALAPELQARIDRVIDSEILAPVMRPLPMALLGILGNDVFLRAPNGQTGLIKQGEELGGVRLVRIGINRVLVEEQGQQSELTIFAGLGSESLLSTKTDSPK